eukprot:814378-Pyramimonas_sp.AAC.1
MATITFPTASAKVGFYQKYRGMEDNKWLDGVFFRNNQTTEEQVADKRLGYTKYHLRRESKHEKDTVQILRGKRM